MTVDETRGQDCDYAADILDFIDNRALCEHWLGEPDFDAARRQDIESAVATTCTGLDKRLAGLRKHHLGDARAVRLLSGFQDLGY